MGAAILCNEVKASLEVMEGGTWRAGSCLGAQAVAAGEALGSSLSGELEVQKQGSVTGEWWEVGSEGCLTLGPQFPHLLKVGGASPWRSNG